MKRSNVLSWDDYFMGLAHLSAMRSKDPSTQVGAAIVNPQHRVIGIGYNGFPFGCDDDVFPWAREGKSNDTKYPYVVHAELNAILNCSQSCRGCTLYVSLFPCNECAKAIIQSGITKIVISMQIRIMSLQARRCWQLPELNLFNWIIPLKLM